MEGSVDLAGARKKLNDAHAAVKQKVVTELELPDMIVFLLVSCRMENIPGRPSKRGRSASGDGFVDPVFKRCVEGVLRL